MSIKIGADGGNNSIKLIINGVEMTYENLYCDRDGLTLDQEYLMNGQREIHKGNLERFLDVKVTSNGETSSFLFGKQAEKYRTQIKERVNDFKSDDIQIVRSTVVALSSSLIKSVDPSQWQDKMTFNIDLCTGLPFHEYKNETKRNKYIKAFVGTHNIEFLNPSFPVREVELNIDNSIVEIEGLAALRQTLLDDKTIELPLEQIEERVFGMIDIGCYTTDIVGGFFESDVDEEGEEFAVFTVKNDLCTGITKGVGTAIDNTISEMDKKYKDKPQNEKFSRQQVIKASNNKGVIIGTQYSIEPFFTNECTQLGKNIGKKFSELYKSSGDMSRLMKINLSGGGSYNKNIINGIEEVLKEQGFDTSMINVIEDPVYANAQGYYNIAECSFDEQID